jgi:diaminopimelate epimerase
MQKAPPKQAPRFYKLHGAGNDVVVLHSEEMPAAGKAAFVRRVAHRQLGIGCDQVVELLSLRPLAIQIWNQDGTKAEMCANGSRCFLFLAALEKWIPRSAARIKIQISGKPYEGLRATPGNYELCLGRPEIGEPEILPLGEGAIPFWPVRTGNPHAVILLGTGPGEWKAPKDFSYLDYGPRIEKHPRFPLRTNVEFVHGLKLRGKAAAMAVLAWERGAGATLSCGSGAVAAAALVRKRTGAQRIEVEMTEFRLRVRFEDERAYLSGPCVLVARGRIF